MKSTLERELKDLKLPGRNRTASYWGAGSAMSKRGNSRARAPRAGVAKKEGALGEPSREHARQLAVLLGGGRRGVRSGQPPALDSWPPPQRLAEFDPVPGSNHSPAASASTSRGLGKRHVGRWPLALSGALGVTAPQLSEHALAAPAQAAEASHMNGRERVGR